MQFWCQLHLNKARTELIKTGDPPHLGLHIYIIECDILSSIKQNWNFTKWETDCLFWVQRIHKKLILLKIKLFIELLNRASYCGISGNKTMKSPIAKKYTYRLSDRDMSTMCKRGKNNRHVTQTMKIQETFSQEVTLSPNLVSC